MAPRGMITVVAVLCFTLGLLGPASAAHANRGRACCTGYTKKQVPFDRIKGYREQSDLENCRIKAIIFYTVKKVEICANPDDAWVKRNLELLSSRLKKMSKAGSAAGETQTSKSVTPSFNGGGGSVFSTAEISPKSTESVY